MRRRILLLTAVLAALNLSPHVLAQDEPSTPPPAADETAASPRDERLALAVLDFDSSDPAAGAELGGQIADMFEAILSGEPNLRLVTRRDLKEVLEEQKINLSGVVSTDEAVKIGELVGARLLVTGRAFVLGDRRFVAAKLIGTETSLVKGVLVKGEADTDVAELVLEASDKLAELVRHEGARLVASDEPAADPLPGLKKKLAARQRPVVAVVIPEAHRDETIPDPACETEIERLLRACEITIRNVKAADVAQWAKSGKPDLDSWPASLKGVDIVITGEAFSAYGTQLNGLISCTARGEVAVIARDTNEIIHVGRVTTAAVHLSEETAAKRALQRVGHQLGLEMLEYLADHLEPVDQNKPEEADE